MLAAGSNVASYSARGLWLDGVIRYFVMPSRVTSGSRVAIRTGLTAGSVEAKRSDTWMSSTSHSFWRTATLALLFPVRAGSRSWG